MSVITELTRCANCGTRAPRFPMWGDDRLTRCGACASWSHSGGVEAEAAATLYDEQYFNGGEYSAYSASSKSLRRNFLRKLRLLRQHGLPPPGQVRMVELGAATGEFLQVAREAGVEQSIGIEVSPYALRVAGERGLRVLSPFDDATESAIRSFAPNLLIGWDVWEHLPNPADTWERLLRAAAPRCLVALTTVDASSLVARLRGPRWRQYHPPTHLNYPTRTALRSYFEHRGFHVVYQRAFGYYRTLREYMRVLSLRCGPHALWDTPIFLDLRDTQLVIARRLDQGATSMSSEEKKPQ